MLSVANTKLMLWCKELLHASWLLTWTFHKPITSSPGSIYEDLMYTAYAEVDWVQHHANSLINQAPEAKLWRHQMRLVAVCFPYHLYIAWPSFAENRRHSSGARQFDAVSSTKFPDPVHASSSHSAVDAIHVSTALYASLRCCRTNTMRHGRHGNLEGLLVPYLLHVVQLEVLLQGQPRHCSHKPILHEGLPDTACLLGCLQYYTQGQALKSVTAGCWNEDQLRRSCNLGKAFLCRLVQLPQQ